MVLKNSKVAKEIARKLIQMKDNNDIVVLHTRQVHRDLIPYGPGSCSADRCLRKMRQYGYISYENPKRNNFLYEIKINEKIKELIKEGK